MQRQKQILIFHYVVQPELKCGVEKESNEVNETGNFSLDFEFLVALTVCKLRAFSLDSSQ